MTYDSVKVLVLGDSGVGKSSLVHLICHQKIHSSPSWTIGISIDVKVHDYKEGTKDHKPFFIEFHDIGGSCQHATSRSIFYKDFHGVILVHDLSNKKSLNNLRRWLGELFSKESHCDHFDVDAENMDICRWPILVIGTKLDLVDDICRFKRTSHFAAECGAEELHLSCTNSRQFAPGTSHAVALSKFFDRVIDGWVKLQPSNNHSPYSRVHARVPRYL